jgi:hypothetical protein
LPFQFRTRPVPGKDDAMATIEAQRKWRRKNRLVKSQLNIMARKQVHDDLVELADSYGLRGKAEAATFAVFVTKALVQHAEFKTEAARMIDTFAKAYHRERDLYAP